MSSSLDNILLATVIIGTLGSFAGGIYLGYKYGHIQFLQTAHYVSLVFLLIAGILTWAAMVWMVHPSQFKVTTKQYISLFFSILISFLWWGRYAFTIAEAAADSEASSILADREDITDDI